MVRSNPLTTFTQISDEWETVLSDSPVNTVFQTRQWQEVWWETFGKGRTMVGFYLTEAEGVTAIAPLTRSGDTLTLVGNQDTVDYNDFLVKPGHEAALYDAVLECMDELQCHTLTLASLTEASPTLEYLPDLARQRGFSVEVEREDVASGIVLPETWDDYLSVLSKKDRHELRRKLRRLEALPDWRWYSLTDQEEVSERLGDFIGLMRLSKADKNEWMTPQREAFFHRMTQQMSRENRLRLFFMEMEGRAVATSLCFDYGSSRLLYNSGYNPEFSYYSVSLLLDALCLREAIELEMQYFDFLRGDESYKGHLGGKQHVLYQMVVKRN